MDEFRQAVELHQKIELDRQARAALFAMGWVNPVRCGECG